MSAAKALDDCARFDRALHAYVDGELDPSHAVDVEAHLRRCSTCFENVSLLRAMRQSLKRTKSMRCSSSLQTRISTVIACEQNACGKRESDETPRLVKARYALAVAATAAAVFGFAWVQKKPNVTDTEPSRVTSTASFQSLLDDLVALHAKPLPPETTNPDDLPRFDPFVGVPVRRPAFPFLDASFKGARVHAVRDRRAALLQYTVSGGHRVTVYLFDSRSLPVQNAPILRPRMIRKHRVYVGNISGYSVAAAERSGVGYALASDLGDEESSQLLAAATTQ